MCNIFERWTSFHAAVVSHAFAGTPDLVEAIQSVVSRGILQQGGGWVTSAGKLCYITCVFETYVLVTLVARKRRVVPRLVANATG